MMSCRKLATLALVIVCLAPLDARTKKGDGFLAQGRAAEAGKQYDQALELFEQALSEDPADSGYQLAMRRVRFQAGQFHVERGLKLRADGKTAEALAEFEKAYAVDSSSSIAGQELRRTRGILERERQQALSPEGLKPEERGLTAADLARQEAQARLDRILPVPELQSLASKPIDLKIINEPPKVLFETVGKVAGVTVIYDPEVQSGAKPLSVEFHGSTLEQALDYLSAITKSFWKPLSQNTIFVTQDNPAKRRDYDDQVVKVFYLKNVQTQQELQEIANDVRSVCDIRRLYTYSGQMALVVRAETDRVALAEKVIADLDKPKPEVVIDVLVLEHNYDKTRDLAFGLADGLNSPIVYKGAGPDSSDSSPSIRLNRIQHLSTGQYSVVLPNGSLQATLKKANTRVLQSPQVRAIDSAKAILKIGNRVPTASGSFQPGIGGVGINPLVNTQFQFLDVGVNVDITPKVHGIDEVFLHVEMDISNVTDHVDLGGISQPVIGQRKVTFDVRMREGEVNVLGGLMQAQQSRTMTGWPGLSGIPLLGRLFSRESTDNSVSELLFVLIPHIVRTQEITETNIRGVATGGEASVKLSYAPPRSAPAIPAALPARSAQLAPANQAAPAALSFMPPRAEAQSGSTITVGLMIENASDLSAASFRIRFDSKIMRLNDVAAGSLLTSDGKQMPPLSKNILNDTGEASVTLSRVAGAGGVSGSGVLAVFVFQAAGSGTGAVSFSDLTLQDAKLQTIPAKPPQLTITVR